MSQGFSGVGLVDLYPRLPGGTQGIGRFVGNCPKLSIRFDPKAVERNSAMDTSRGPLRRMTQATGATIELTSDEFNKKNFALAVGGRIDSVTASTALTHASETGMVVGDLIALPDKNVSNVVVTDSTGSPKTLAADQYELDAFAGSIKLLDITTGGPYVQPFHVAYDKGAVAVIAGLAVTELEQWLVLRGTNVDTGERGILDVYRARFPASQVIDFLSNDYVDFTFTGTVLQDTGRLAADVGGQYFKFTVPSTIE